MKRNAVLLLAFLLLAFLAAAQAEDSLPAHMTGPENLAPPGQAVTATVVTPYGTQYHLTLRLDEVQSEDYNTILLFTLTQGEVIPAEGAHADYLSQRFGSSESIIPDYPMLLHPGAFALVTDLEEEYPYTPDGFAPADSEEFEYEPLLLAPGEEIRFKVIFEYVDDLVGARLRFQDTGIYPVFGMRPDLMEGSIAWFSLE
jgi:hypothetical protein